MAARELRYEWFHKICQDNGLDYIATAHHLDDNLETFLINFTRGTGLNGLTGIPEIKSNIVRPLLPFSREEIESFAEDNKLTWREDESNAKTAYQRNKIRHQIVPLLKEMNPNLLTTFQNTTNHLKDSQRIITDTIESVKKTVVSHAATGSIQKLDIKKLKQFENPKAYLFELLKSYGFSEWNDIVALLDAQSGKQVFSASHRLLKDRDYLLLTEINSAQANKVIYEIQEGQEILPLEHFKLFLKRVDLENQHDDATNSVCIDIDKLTFPLRLRKMKTGDYFFPLGMAGKKKVSKFFKDEKLSLIEKENTWLLCSNNDIVWVVNRRLDDRYKVQHNTKNILQVEFLQV
jgi:tRNA(Ile)-lysidine synthase